jgi:hypothetical protein
MDNDDFKMIVIPNYLNPDAPKGETLVLVFTIDELERARRRGESVVRNRKEGKVDATGCLKIS